MGERLNVRRAVLASSVGSVHGPRGYRYLRIELCTALCGQFVTRARHEERSCDERSICMCVGMPLEIARPVAVFGSTVELDTHLGRFGTAKPHIFHVL